MAGALHDAALHGAALHVVTLLTVTTDDADDDESCVCDVRSGVGVCLPALSSSSSVNSN